MPKISQDHKKSIQRKVESRRKTRAFAPPTFPDSIVLEYGKSLIAEVNKIDALLKEILFPHLDKITNTKDERLDSAIRLDLELKQLAGVALVAELMRRIKSKFYGEIIGEDSEPSQRLFTRSMRRVAKKHLDRTKEFTEKKFIKEFENQTGTKPLPQQLDVKEFIADATRKNVALIKTIPQRYFGEIERLTSEAVSKGQLSSTLKKELLKVKETTKTSSRLLARDQISKLTGVINEARQRKLGITEYIWKTQLDQRVRSFANTNGASDHKRLESTIQKWSEPPTTTFKGKLAGQRTHPGSAIQCRCFASPVFDSITGIQHPDTVKARAKVKNE